MLQLAATAGLRVSELTVLSAEALHLGTGAHVACNGKRRRRRITPLDRQTADILHRYISALPTGSTVLFPTREGTQVSRDAVAARLTLHASTASHDCPSLTTNKITPHVLRHSAAMRLLAAGIDTTVIAHWLGHQSIETTQVSLHADMKLKETALARTTPTGTKTGRYYKPSTDKLLAFLRDL